MAEAALLAISKISIALGDEATKVVIAKLSGKVSNLRELPDKVEYIRRELRVMKDVIQDLDSTNISMNVVKGWIDELRKLAYHIEDVMDKYSYYACQLQQEGSLMRFMKGAHYASVFSEVASEVMKIKGDLEQVRRHQMEWFPTLQAIRRTPTDNETLRSQGRTKLLDSGDPVGIEYNRKKLLELLYSNDEPGHKVITVSGMGGLGKTTLALDVYEREKIKFPVHAWITVSQTYTTISLLRQFVRQVVLNEQESFESKKDAINKMGVNELIEELNRKAENFTTCLIVLDDVWDQNVYFEIQGVLKNLQACRIIITTRMEHVAVLAPSECHLKIQVLGEADAFNLFCRRAFYNRKGHRCPPDLENVAASIVRKCKGLPLAIVTMGGLMSSKLPTERAWQQMYNQLRSELAKNDDVKTILKLSYHALSADQKNCFLFCSLFPEDYPISCESLVRYWVAEGFAVRVEHNGPEDVAEINLMELIHRNMLEVEEHDELGRVSSCKLHDIVRNLALSIAKQERFGHANDFGAMEKIDWEVRRLSLFLNNDKGCASIVKFPHLRTLLGTISQPPGMLSSIFSESKYLTVLELQDSDITEVPESIGKLFNLRYIGLRRTRLRSLPESIEKLSNLQTLDIKLSKIERLPEGITKIKKLRHLLADRYADETQSGFRYITAIKAPKDLSNLEELQTLQTMESSKHLAEQLKKLMKLRCVWIDNISSADCANIFPTLSNMPSLSSLLLSAKDENEPLCFESLKPTSTKLQVLIIRGQWTKSTLDYPIFCSHDIHLKYLSVSWCHLGEDPLGILSSRLENLTYLRLNNMHSAKRLVLDATAFPCLKTLVLMQMPDVNQIKIMNGALPVIEGLYILALSGLESVPPGIETLRTLKKLWLIDLHRDFKDHWIDSEMHQKMQHVPELRAAAGAQGQPAGARNAGRQELPPAAGRRVVVGDGERLLGCYCSSPGSQAMP
uniref:Uncharacterized protein n=1 Tax=Leersia perrieri TaxID=77586 RepID=A0A0D9XQI9_9ORYZ